MQEVKIEELKVVSLIGAPGSGKTTVGKMLEEKFGFGRLVSGDMFRRVAEEDSERGRLIKHITSNRLLVPPDVSRPLIQAELEVFLETKKSVVIDGYPRNVGQLEVIEGIHPSVLFVEITVSHEEGRKRIEKAKDRGDRIDDKVKEVFERGFKTFENETVPMIEGIKANYPERFLRVDGLQKPEEIAAEIGSWATNKN